MLRFSCCIALLTASVGHTAPLSNVIDLLVEPLDKETQSCGFNDSELRTRARYVVEGGGWKLNGDSSDYLYIQVTGLRTGGGCAVGINVSIKRLLVYPDTGKRIFGSTVTRSWIGTTPLGTGFVPNAMEGLIKQAMGEASEGNK